MLEPLPCPDIVSPYGFGEEGFHDQAFVQDLGVDDLLSEVPFHPANVKESRAFAKNLLVRTGSDKKTVEYRQAVFKDLVPNTRLRDNVRQTIRVLSELAYKLDRFEKKKDLPIGLALARFFLDILDRPNDLADARSDALRSVSSFFVNVRASSGFSQLKSLLDRINDSSEVAFRVSIDKNGSPLKMYALELVKKDPREKRGFLSLLETLLGKKRYEHNLRTARGLNELGKMIGEYLEKQLVPTIHACTPQMRELARLLEPLDFYVGFSEYFAALKETGIEICTPTLFASHERRLTAINARNPVLLKNRDLDNKSIGTPSIPAEPGIRKRQIVPNGIRHHAGENLFVITGPNNGGKTTYVKTVGLVQLLSQKGLPVPAESAEVSFVDGIYTHFVTPDDITKGEGRYRNELRRIKDIFEKATPYSLIILDEPCGGTRYEEGLRQSLAVLDGFHKLGSATFFTTHMHPLTVEVDNGKYPAAKNLTVDWSYSDGQMHYSYKIVPGAADKSYGEEIAREMGLMPENIEETVSQKAEEGGYEEILRERFP